MFTVGLAFAESLGTSNFVLLYAATFVLDLCFIEVLSEIFKRK